MSLNYAIFKICAKLTRKWYYCETKVYSTIIGDSRRQKVGGDGGTFAFILLWHTLSPGKIYPPEEIHEKSRPTSILSQSLFEAFARTVCVLHLIYVAVQHRGKYWMQTQKENRISQKRKSGLAKGLDKIRFWGSGGRKWAGASFWQGTFFREDKVHCKTFNIMQKSVIIFNIDPTPEIFLVLAHRAMISDNQRTRSRNRVYRMSQMC